MACGKSILIVDDDSNIRRVVRACLESDGHSIEESSDGADALEKFVRSSHDLILLDLAMPVLDGMSVLADIHDSYDSNAQAPPRVIVMTAHGSVRAAIKAMQMGAADFIEKPFTPAELRQSVANIFTDAAHAATHEKGPLFDSLQSVRDALRRGRFYAAEASLSKASTSLNEDHPDVLNLVGVLHEAHGRRHAARGRYEKALAIDPLHGASRKNFVRLDQIDQRGSTDLDIALGDEITNVTAFRAIH